MNTRLLLASSLALTSLASLPVAQRGARDANLSQSSSTSASSAPGSLGDRPGGSGQYFVDPHQGGTASEVKIVELAWGRLVDVHALDARGRTVALPEFRDFVIDPDIQGDGVDYRLETNPATQRERLVILDRVGPRFYGLLAAADALAPLPTAGPGAPLVGLLPRNATLVVRMDDLLDDGGTASTNLFETVRVLTGYPPSTPFPARVVFDRNHGGVVGGRLHATRVLADMTVSQVEAGMHPVPLPLNGIGLPPSSPSTSGENVLLAIPTKTTGAQFNVLTNLAGNPLATTGNGPVAGNPSMDVVRAMRSGNGLDPNNGFLLDLEPPQLIGWFSVSIERSKPVGHGLVRMDVRVSSECPQPLRTGDVLVAGTKDLEILAPGDGPDATGLFRGVVAAFAEPFSPAGGAPTGSARHITPYDPASPVDAACWIRITPTPSQPPSGGVHPAVQILARFSEPIDPETLDGFDSLRVLRGGLGTVASSTTIVPANVYGAPDFVSASLAPALPLSHTNGSAEEYVVEIGATNKAADGEVRDLAGNPLLAAPDQILLQLDPNAPTQLTGGLALRFASTDEIEPIGLPDLRGQVFYDFANGEVKPRPIVHISTPIDRGNPVPGIMIPFPAGTQSPLSPFGSKVQSVWRYADAAWGARDETKYNLDVEGLSWAPIGGLLIRDYFERFEILLGHSERLPDEAIDGNLLPKHAASGLFGAPNPFDDNVLDDPNGTASVVHSRSLGYVIDPVDLYVNAHGTTMIPYPLNRVGGPYRSYTWRDTAVTGEAGAGSAGVPLDVETGAPLQLEPLGSEGSLYAAGEVRSTGLPLLMEFRCFPSSTALGLNALDVSLAINSSARPNFRAYSTGGVNATGNAVTKDPDLEQVPTGGFNPSSTPPGLPTRFTADNTFYVGQLDTVTRVSRAHTVWMDTGVVGPDYAAPILDATVPPGTSMVLDFRGATQLTLGTAPFDATRLDAYGELTTGGTITFGALGGEWSRSIDALDGERYLQARLSFIGNVGAGTTATLDAIGIPFAE